MEHANTAAWIKNSFVYLRATEILLESEEIDPLQVMEQCQQAIECALKAYLSYRNIRFGGTHDIETLSNFIKQDNPILSSQLEPLYYLSDFAGANRYLIKLGQLKPRKQVHSSTR